MNEDKAYLDVAKRYLDSCEKHIANNDNIQEVIGFNGYHALESVAGAFNAHHGHSIPRRHIKKLNLFVTNSARYQLVSRRAIAALVITLHSVRSNCLYPEKIGATFKKFI